MISWLKQVFGIPEQKKSAVLAKERLMVIVAHERGEQEGQPDFLPLLQKELTEVIAKYVKIDQDQVQVDFEEKGGRSVLELNVTLPEYQLKAMKPQVKAATPSEPVTIESVEEKTKPATQSKAAQPKAKSAAKKTTAKKTPAKKPTAKKTTGKQAAAKTTKTAKKGS